MDNILAFINKAINTLFDTSHDDQKNEMKFNNINKAIQESNMVEFNRLIKDIDPNLKNYNGDTLFHEVVKSNNLDLAKILKEKNFDVSAIDNLGNTPLHYVKSPEMLKFLAENHANVSARNFKGETLIHSIKYVELLKELLSNYQTNVDDKDYKGNSALHLTDSIEITETLLENEANVNTKNIFGNTALHTVKSLEKAEKLIENKANLTEKNNEGRTVLHTAQNSEVLELFVKKNSHIIDFRDNDGNTALHIFSKNPEISSILINNGANKNIKNYVGIKAFNEDSQEITTQNNDSEKVTIENISDNKISEDVKSVNHKNDYVENHDNAMHASIFRENTLDHSDNLY